MIRHEIIKSNQISSKIIPESIRNLVGNTVYGNIVTKKVNI